VPSHKDGIHPVEVCFPVVASTMAYHFHFWGFFRAPKLPRRSELHVLITESHLSICSRYPVTSRQIATNLLIAIKPEHILELVVERRPVGGMGLTLSVRHAVPQIGSLASHGSSQSASPVCSNYTIKARVLHLAATIRCQGSVAFQICK
jgi:hypothetical protein